MKGLEWQLISVRFYCKYTTCLDFQKSRRILTSSKAVPRTISAMLVVEDLSSNEKVAEIAKTPVNNIPKEVNTLEILVLLTISGQLYENTIEWMDSLCDIILSLNY